MMSWSDKRSKIVKNAHSLKKFEFIPFDPEEMGGDHDNRLEVVEEEIPFVTLGGDLQPHSSEFIPLKKGSSDGTESADTTTVDSRRDDPLEKKKEESVAAAGDKGEVLPDTEPLDMLRKTREDMERLKEDTLRNCAVLEKDAWEKGFEKGAAAGIEAGEKKTLPMLTDVNTLLTEIAGLKSMLLKQYEKEIVDLIFSVAEKIVHCEISLDHRVVQETVLHTLQLASEKESLVLRLHPDDIHWIEKLQASSADPSGKLTAVSLSPDPSVSRGGCHLETPHGDIDASIETRLNRVYESLIRGGNEEK